MRRSGQVRGRTAKYKVDSPENDGNDGEWHKDGGVEPAKDEDDDEKGVEDLETRKREESQVQLLVTELS